MDKSIRIAVILSAVDNMSRIIAGSVNRSQAKLQALSSKSFAFGTASATAAATLAATLYKPITAFAELEDAGLGLKSKLMQDGGIINTAQFEKLTNLSVKLGNKLPGVTSDFTKMFAAMKSNGADVNTMINGTGTAAAYYAIATKQAYDQAGIASTRLQQQLGIANKDMMAAMDMMSRIVDTGIAPTEMEYFFSKSSSALKMFNLQGINTFKTMGVLGSMLVKQFGSGEVAGTGLTKIMNELANPRKLAAFTKSAKQVGIDMQYFDKKGNFIGLENMYIQFARLSSLNPGQLNKVLMPLTGGDGADNSMIGFMAKANIAGFNKQSDLLSKQAQLLDKVNIMLDSLSAKWEAGLGNLTNALAAFGGTLAPLLKRLADLLGALSAKMQILITKYPTLTKYIGITIISLSALLASLAAISFISGTVMMGWMRLSAIGTGLSFVLLRLGQAGLLFGATVRYWAVLLFTRGIPALATMAARLAQSSLVIVTRGIPALASMTAATWAWTVALLANPITWIVAGIIALAAAAYLVYKNWKPITGWFSQQWTLIKAQVSGAIAVFNIFKDVIVGVGRSLIGAFTLNPKMFTDGILQANAAVDKIMNGGISKAYNLAYNQSMGKQSASAGYVPFRADVKPAMVPKRSGPASYIFQPTMNFNAKTSPEDAKAITNDMQAKFTQWMKDHESKKARLGFN